LSGSHLTEILTQGLRQLGEDPANHPIESYLSYVTLLQQWNKAYNLTAIADPEKIITQHIIDSLSVLSYLKGEQCLDVGSGAGLPGLILALANPDQQWTLLDSNSKKTRFMTQVVMDLNINNIEVVHARLEEYLPEKKFTSVVSRAFGSIKKFYETSLHVMTKDGLIIAMKGTNPADEIDEINKIVANNNINVINLSTIDLQRHLVLIST
jgi:16S rRNA (guanine527-N7)-methyltransferase